MMYISIYSLYIISMMTVFYFIGVLVYQNPTKIAALNEIHLFLVTTQHDNMKKAIKA